MRVVELADELGLTMFEILDLCDRIGIEAVNGATEVPERDIARLRRLFGRVDEPAATVSDPADDVSDFPATAVDEGHLGEPRPPVLPQAVASPSSDDVRPAPVESTTTTTTTTIARSSPAGASTLRWLLPLAVAALVVVAGALVLGGGADAGSPGGEPASALSLQVGTCFNAPEGRAIAQVGVVDCAQPHAAEVFVVAQHPASADAPFPGSEDLAASAEDRCADEFVDYVGPASGLAIGVTHPSETSWVERFDRTLICSVVGADGSPLTRAFGTGG